MKIAHNKNYGDPSTIRIIDRPIPSVKPDEIRVRVVYSTVNRTDIGFLYGRPFVTRFFTGLFKPLYSALGCEFAGVVDEIGAAVTEFSIGDRVFGFDDARRGFGGHAEYKVIKSRKMVTTIPNDVTFAQAAAGTEGAHYALAFINKSKIKPSDKVFVHGATGAIGSAMVQLLVARGADVAASSTTDLVKIVEGFGVTEVIDWQTTPLDSINQKFDFFADAVGKSSFGVARELLRPGGVYTSSELGKNGENVWLSMINPIQRLFTKRTIVFPVPSTGKALLEEIRHRLDTGEFQPLIDREYELDDIQQAYEYVETGNKKGNVLIRIGASVE